MIDTIGKSETLSELWRQNRLTADTSYQNPAFLTGNEQASVKELNQIENELNSKSKGKQPYWTKNLQPLLTQTSPHMSQVRFHYQVTTNDNNPNLEHADLQSFIFFDDLWINSNPDLAESILNYAEGWDVLFESPR